MASTPSLLLIMCPHCSHAMTEHEGELRCGTCHVAWVPPVWHTSDDEVPQPQFAAAP